MTDMAYLGLLSESFPDAVSAAGGIADAEARLGLLKPVELFVSDVHGEYEEFSHILKNACGGIRRSIDAAFGSSLNAQEKDALVSLVCYPREKAALASRAQDAGAWQARAVAQLTTLLAYVAARHTRAQVRAALPKAYAGMVEELLAAERPGMDGRGLPCPHRGDRRAHRVCRQPDSGASGRHRTPVRGTPASGGRAYTTAARSRT